MDEDIKSLLEKNLKMTEEIHAMVKSMKSYIFWQRIFSVLKLLLIIIPIVLALIYLPPFLEEIFAQYESLINLGQTSAAVGVDAPVDLEGIKNLLQLK